MKNIWIRLLTAVLILGAVYGGYQIYKQIPRSTQAIATTKVEQSDVVVRSFTRGELRAVRSVTLIAPNLFGTVQVTRLAPLGAFANEKDLVVEFDDSEVLARLEEKQLEIEQVNEQIKKAEADLAVRNNQDQVELLTTRFDVRRAELEVKRNELLSTIDAKKNELTLDESKRKLKQLESDIRSRLAQAQAQLAVLRANKTKATLEMEREQKRLQDVKLLAPMSGLVAIRQNRPSFFFPGMQIPEIREGDQVQPGMPIADVLDLSELEVLARVGEVDRANLHEGQEALLRLDALPQKQLHGRIKSMSGQASSNIFSSDPAKKFDVVFAVDMRELLQALGAKEQVIRKVEATAEQNRRRGNVPQMQAPPAAPVTDGAPGSQRGGDISASDTQRAATNSGGAGSAVNAPAPGAAGAANQNRPRRLLSGPSSGLPRFTAKDLENAKLPPPPGEGDQLDVLLRPGLLADVEVTVERMPNVIHVPAQAVFQKDGKSIVYVKSGSDFEQRPVKLLKRSESTMVISEGVKPGELVALADPTVKKDADDKPKGGAMGALPGGKK